MRARERLLSSLLLCHRHELHESVQRRLKSTIRFSILCKTDLHAVFLSIFQGLVVGIGYRILRVQLYYTVVAEIICFINENNYVFQL